MRDLLKANAGLIGVGLAAFVLMGASQLLYGPSLPVFSRNFGIGLGAAGLLISAVGSAARWRSLRSISMRPKLTRAMPWA